MCLAPLYGTDAHHAPAPHPLARLLYTETYPYRVQPQQIFCLREQPCYHPLPLDFVRTGSYRITSADFAAYASMTPQWNGTLVLGLNFRNGTDPALAINHITAALAYPGLAPLVEAVEVGNEVSG